MENKQREVLNNILECVSRMRWQIARLPNSVRDETFERDLEQLMKAANEGEQALASQPAPSGASPNAIGPDARAYAHKCIERVTEMRKLDLERAKEPNAVDCDYYLGRAYRCDDILFWLREYEARIEAGAPVASAREPAAQSEREHYQVMAATILNNRCATYMPRIDHGDWLRLRDTIAQDLASARATAAPESSPASPPIEMAVCEIAWLVLKPGELYRFYVMKGCEKCKAYFGDAAPPATERGVRVTAEQVQAAIPDSICWKGPFGGVNTFYNVSEKETLARHIADNLLAAAAQPEQRHTPSFKAEGLVIESAAQPTDKEAGK